MNAILAGGVMVVPLAVCLILALAIVVERLWVLRNSIITPAERVAFLCAQVSEYNALDKLKQSYDGNALHRLLIVALENEGSNHQQMRLLMQQESELIRHDLSRFLNALGSITTISPLLGLLGTVLGMIQVFEAVLENGVGIAPTLSGGISQALVTTAMGMAIAIPSMVFYRFFNRRIDSLLINLETCAINILEEYRSH